MYRSKCCKAQVVVEGSDEGTMYHVCTKCNKPCDVKSVKISKKKFKKLIKIVKE